TCDLDSVVEDLQTGKEQILLNPNGGGGHYALGYGKMILADNWNRWPNVWRLWDLSVNLVAGLPFDIDNLLQGTLLYHDWNWNVFEPSHVSWENANASVPVNQQYACGSSANAINSPHANEIECFMLNGSGKTLVVAPVMTNMSADGGDVTCSTCTNYAKDPKGNIDPTGQYFFWTTNLDGGRLDAFMVKIPAQRLINAPSSNTPPAIAIKSPTAGVSLSGTVTFSASASASAGVSAVEFIVDDKHPSATLTQPPYSIPWNTDGISPGIHTLTAVVIDKNGDTATSRSIAVDVKGTPGGASPAVSITSPPNDADLSGTVTVSASATSSTGIASVRFELDGGSGPSATLTQSPYSVSWDTSDVSPGQHTLTAIATDTSGNVATSTIINVHVEGPAPPPSPGPGPGNGGAPPPRQPGHSHQAGGGGLDPISILLLLSWLAYSLLLRMCRRGKDS
ncbi:MAG: Ig-like domain-containing protein, partial [Gammaproteobacteria bacterium]